MSLQIDKTVINSCKNEQTSFYTSYIKYFASKPVADILNSILSTAITIATTPSWLLLLATVYVITMSFTQTGSSTKSKCVVLSLWILVDIAPLGDWLIQPLEQRIAIPENIAKIKGVIVLGGGQRVGTIQHSPYSGYGSHTARTLAGLSIAQHQQVPIYFLGAQQHINELQFNESHVISSLHSKFSLDVPLMIDNDSTNTFDNAMTAKRLIPSVDVNNYLLITTAAHMPRAVGSFQQAGMSPIPYPVNFLAPNAGQWFGDSPLTTRLYLIDYAAHEWLGLAQYYVLGRSNELFPKTTNKSLKSTTEIKDTML